MKQVDFWRFSEQSACKKIAIDRQTKIHENIENREAKTHKNGKNFDVMSCVDVIIECLLHSNQSFFKQLRSLKSYSNKHNKILLRISAHIPTF